MESPADVVRSWSDAINGRDLVTLETLLTDDVRYHNIGMEPTLGRQAVLVQLKQEFEMFDTMINRFRHLAVDGNNVLAERVLEMTTAGVVAPLPLMAKFEVREGCIAAWHNYFDFELNHKLFSGENTSELVPQY